MTRQEEDGFAEVVRRALDADDGTALNGLLGSPDCPMLPVELLHRLLLHPDHIWHQRVTFALQRVGDPSSVDVAVAVLEGGFERFAYKCSEDGVIAKWFSWLLADIGTAEAEAALERFARHPNREIASEMRYRLEMLRAHRRTPSE